MKCHGAHDLANEEQPAHQEHCEILNGPIANQIPKPPTGRKEDAPNFEKVAPEDCTHTGYHVPMGWDTLPIGLDAKAVLISYGILCMRCGKTWAHVQLTETPLAKLPNVPTKEIIRS